MKRIIIVSLVASFIGIAGCSPQIDRAKLDAYFDTLAANNRLMGSVAISRNNKLIYAKSVGFADIEQGLKANENTRYRVASVTKTFTAALILKAIEENKLNLHQTIDQFFPTIENVDKITIEHLLYHRSGIPDYLVMLISEQNTTQLKTEQELIEKMSHAGSDFEPDTSSSYSNSNYALLTFILEKIYRKPYSEILEEKIIKPIGLKNTYYGGKINTKDNNECYSYQYNYNGWGIEPETDISVLLGAGGIVSTPVDLILFSQALFTGKLLSESSLEQMKTLKDDYGAGLVHLSFDDKTGCAFAGRIDGFGSWFGIFPDDNISFAYIANGVNVRRYDIQSAILNAVCNKPFEIPEYITFHLPEEDLDKYTGVYSNAEIPMTMDITKVNNKLLAQGTGMPSLPLEPTKKDIFEFFPIFITIEFNPTDKTMVLKQGDTEITFEKEE